MHRPKRKHLVIASAAALSLAGGAYAVAGSSAPTPITGSVTDKINEAVTDKYPGATVVGIESETGGTFEAHVRQKDGTLLDVELSSAYAITGTHEGRGMGAGGGMGPGGGMGHMGGMRGPGMDTAALAKALGVSEDKLTAALDKVRQDRPKDELAATLAKALGATTSDVQEVLDAQRKSAQGGQSGGMRGRGPGFDRDALVAALAKKLNIAESKVTAALDDARPDPSARRDALATALAKELGLDASKVKDALAAQAPTGRP